MGFYTGPIDAIMGPLTREAIMGFQKSRGAKVTGYLTLGPVRRAPESPVSRTE